MNDWLLAVGSGVLYVLGFPGFDGWPLAFVAFVPVLHALSARELRLRRALAIGFAFGATVQLFGFAWLIATLRAFSSLPLFGCALAYLAICALQAGRQTLFACALWAIRRRGRSPLLFAPFAYAAVELGYPALFQNYFAASLHRVPLLMQLAALGGPTSVSAMLVGCNALLYASVSRALRERGLPARELAGAITLVGLTLAYGLAHEASVARAVAHAEKLEVGIVQANMHRLEKREARAEGRRRHLEQSQQLERGFGQTANGRVAPDLIVWPETALQYLLPTSLKSARQMLAGLGTPVLFGGLGHRVVEGHAELYNSAFLADADGRVLGRSDKGKLIPFAEYIPLGDRFPALYDWLPNSGEFTPASQPKALPLGKHRIATLICYEDVLPGFVRDVVQETRAQLLVSLSNDVWFGRSREPAIHFALSQLRAIEEERYLVRANNSGLSGVIDATGHVVVASELLVRASLRARVAWLDGVTWYRKLGDLPAWLALLATLLGASLPPLVFNRTRQ